MSIWSGLVAAGVAIALAIVAFGQPVWEYRREDSQSMEVWSYGPFIAGQKVYDNMTGLTTFRNYTYAQLAGLPPGRAQPNMAKVFGEFDQFVILGLLSSIAGVFLAVLSRWKNVRGLYAGIAFLAGCASILYAIFTIAFAIPTAASRDLATTIPQFGGGTTGSVKETWNPIIGWYVPIGSGLALAWASSDLWHIRPAKKALPMKVELALKRVGDPPALVPLPPAEPEPVVAREPLMEEVFVIGSNGLLIKHMSRSLMTDKDRDVVGSMISAISSFVREAFSERDGEVQEVSLGDHHFVMCNEGGVVVAVLVTSGNTEDIVPRLRRLLGVLRDRYVDRLANWQGEPLEGIEDELAVLWDPHPLPLPPAE